jgi:hypothetical protein
VTYLKAKKVAQFVDYNRVNVVVIVGHAYVLYARVASPGVEHWSTLKEQRVEDLDLGPIDGLVTPTHGLVLGTLIAKQGDALSHGQLDFGTLGFQACRHGPQQAYKHQAT